MRRVLAVLGCIGLGGLASGQVGPSRAVVLTRLTGTPAAAVLDVDLAAGRFAQLGRFPGDDSAPLAITVDPVRADYVVALAAGTGSAVRRLTWRGRSLVFHRLMAMLPGPVTALHVTDDGDVFAAVGGASGAVYRVPRATGTASRVTGAADPTALFSFGIGSQATQAWVAEHDTSGTPFMRLIDVRDGRTWAGPYRFTGFGARITGLTELPTGLPRHLVTDDRGRLSLSVLYQTPVPLNTTPVLSPGATRALHVDTARFEAFAVGGKAHPFLKSVVGFGGTLLWKTLAGPFPGDPADFDLGPSQQPGVQMFGRGCARVSLPPFIYQGSGGPPRIGNLSFGLAASQVTPLAPVVFVLGASEQSFGPVPLPVPLPLGACTLYVAPEILAGQVAGGRGTVAQPLPIPNLAALAGVTFFGQWIEPRSMPAGPTLANSPAAAVHVHR